MKLCNVAGVSEASKWMLARVVTLTNELCGLIMRSVYAHKKVHDTQRK